MPFNFLRTRLIVYPRPKLLRHACNDLLVLCYSGPFALVLLGYAATWHITSIYPLSYLTVWLSGTVGPWT